MKSVRCAVRTVRFVFALCYASPNNLSIQYYLSLQFYFCCFFRRICLGFLPRKSIWILNMSTQFQLRFFVFNKIAKPGLTPYFVEPSNLCEYLLLLSTDDFFWSFSLPFVPSNFFYTYRLFYRYFTLLLVNTIGALLFLFKSNSSQESLKELNIHTEIQIIKFQTIEYNKMKSIENEIVLTHIVSYLVSFYVCG